MVARYSTDGFTKRNKNFIFVTFLQQKKKNYIVVLDSEWRDEAIE